MAWREYSKKLAQKIENPRHVGFFSKEEALERGVRLVIGRQTSCFDQVALFLLVDESDGVIADAKFQARGRSSLMGASEAACELLMRKNHDQAGRITAEFIDQHLQDKKGREAFPKEAYSDLNLVIDAIQEMVEQCRDIPLAENALPTPLDFSDLSHEGGYPEWSGLSQIQKIALLEEVIATEIRPYIELDEGGIKIIALKEKQLIIAYEGACTSCHSATGATLSAIQNILQSKIDPEITVIPDLLYRGKSL